MKKYRKYKRSQNARCKLSQKNINAIPRLREAGYSYAEIGKMWGVYPKTVARWLKTKEQRRKDARALYERYGKRYYKETPSAVHKLRRVLVKERKAKVLGLLNG